MKLEKVTGIILKKNEINETDVIIDGIFVNRNKEYLKKKFIVYGILKSKKRNPIVIEPCNYVSIDYYEKENKEILNIKEINLIERFYELKKNYKNLQYLSTLLEIVNYASITDSNLKDIYKLFLSALYYLQSYILKHKKIQKTLSILEEYNLDIEDILLLFFIIRILRIMGYVGDLYFCSYCNKEIQNKTKWQKELYFLCENCDPTSNQLDFFYLLILRNILEKKFDFFIENLKHCFNEYHILKENLKEILKPFKEKIESIAKDVLPIKNHLFTTIY